MWPADVIVCHVDVIMWPVAVSDEKTEGEGGVSRAPNAHVQALRERWEEQQREALQQPEVHYANVQFDGGWRTTDATAVFVAV